jgi:hypothetical protein
MENLKRILFGFVLFFTAATLVCVPLVARAKTLVDTTVDVPSSGGFANVQFYAETGQVGTFTLTGSSNMCPYGYLLFPDANGKYVPELVDDCNNGLNKATDTLPQTGTYVFSVLDGTNIGGNVTVLIVVPDSVTTSTAEPSTTTTTTIDGETTTTIASSCPSEQIYGTHSEQTELLRHFRDNILSQTPAGQELIKLYYQWSPVIVQAMENDAEFKEEVKDMIDGVLELMGE